MVLETSPGNRQPFWLFDRPLAPSVAKAVAKSLKTATGSDHGTADITHVWRV
ncbi:DNA-primase RepB domain-containing protein, partial [Mesorhizobium sp. Root157]|uniref:DNA-primase RepB domain-containing protein n=1 Tax=Mesorhizobium sp. Root157 TaxID=1736477 RepID=UPI0039B7630A